MKKLLGFVLFVCVLGSSAGFAAELMYEGFDKTVGTQIKWWNGWTASGTGDGCHITNANLTVSGLLSSTGMAVSLTGTYGQYNYQPHPLTTTQTTNTYFSFALELDGIGAIDTTGVMIFRAHSVAGYDNVQVRQNSSNPSKFDIGLAYSWSGTPVWDDNGGAGYATGQTHFIVVAYGAQWSPDGRLWINPSPGDFGGAAPTNDLEIDWRGAANPLPSFSYGAGANIIVDEIRVGDTWADVTPTGAPVVEPGTTVIVY